MDMLETYRVWKENPSDKDMARSFERKINKIEVIKLIKRVDELEQALADCVQTVEDTKWGYDGDCGLLANIYRIVDAAQESE